MKSLLINMVHHNPCEQPLVTPTNNSTYLAQLGFNGDVVMDALAGCTLSKYDPQLLPTDSNDYKSAMEHRENIAEKIENIKNAGLDPYLYTDIPSIPKRAIDLYPNKLTHKEDKKRLCIACPKLWDIIKAQIVEAFELYPNAKGIFVRFGENYTKFNIPHMIGNDIITKPCSECGKLSKNQRYIEAIHHLNDLVCTELDKKLFIRTWGFGWDSMHMSAKIYKQVTESFKPNKNLFFSIKITRGDFLRYELLNPTLNQGAHNQIVEIQLAREYEGKGAFPNWLAENWQNESSEILFTKKTDLKKNKNLPISGATKQLEFGQGLLKGIFTWTRGGGWGGPYLKYHDWVDVNSFAIGQLAANPEDFCPEKTVMLWCQQQYGWLVDSKESKIFLSVLKDSEQAILKMFYSFDYATRPGSPWTIANELWFRDDHLINNLNGLDDILIWAINNKVQTKLLSEKGQAIDIWENIVGKMNTIKGQFYDKNIGEALLESVQAAEILSKAILALWTARLKWHEHGNPLKPLPDDISKEWNIFRKFWQEYRSFGSKGVATLINTGWQYGQLADAFEEKNKQFPSSAPPIYMGTNGDYLIG